MSKKNGRRDAPTEPPISHWKPPLPKDSMRIMFFCTEAEMVSWMKASHSGGLDPWIRETLNTAVKEKND